MLLVPLQCALLLSAVLALCGCGRSSATLELAIQGRDLARVKTLLQADPKIIHLKDKDGVTALHWAALWGFPEIVEALLKHGADANAVNLRGRTPLHWAATCGHADVAQILLTHGADVKAATETGMTPLHTAAAIGPQFRPSVPVAELLLAKGADINARDQRGRTALHWAATLGHQRFARMLIDEGADFDIFAAATLGDVERVKVLLASECNVACRTNAAGLTPLHWAAINGRVEIAEMLLAKGADVNATDQDGYTPLHLSAADDQAQLAFVLLGYNADVEARTRAGETALERARTHSRGDVARLLEHYEPR